jgi:Uncharacterized protein involved in copper resistance
MSRAKGRTGSQRQPTTEDIKPESPEGRQLGLSPRVQGHPSPIPGGRPHIKNAPSIRHTVPVPPSDPEIGMGNAHGVIPGSHTNAERADHERGPNTVHATMPKPQHHPVHERPSPIPVFIVENAHDDVIRSAAPRSMTVPGNTGADPVRVAGRDPGRTAVLILNESTSSDIRFAQRPGDLNAGGGALLPWPTNSYTRVDTQDELWALSASATAAKLSVIHVFEREM